jgi:LDH2 family malate/lactate/ureidoglycolate dehydrogenase
MVKVRTAEQLTSLATAIFTAAGASPENAEKVVGSLVGANLAGHDSHGVIRIPSYVEDIKKGRLKPAASPFIAREEGPATTVDGASTFGQVGARFATETAVRKARETVMAGVALKRSHHTGRIGEWAERGAAAGLITLATGGRHRTSERTVAPYGGKAPALGTTPIAWAMPRSGGRPPILLDFATSAAARGKLLVARAKGEPLPPGWIVDSEGRPSTNVEDFFNGGFLLPFAGHKGYAMSVIVELMAIGLSGGDLLDASEHGSCLFVLCIDSKAFRPLEEFDRTVESMAERLKAIPPAEGFDEVLLPGEPEARSRAARSRDGIPLPDRTWEALVSVAGELGVGVS